MRTKKTRLPVDWTDIYIENVPIISAKALNQPAVRELVRAVRRGRGRATHSATGRPAPKIQVLAQI